MWSQHRKSILTHLIFSLVVAFIFVCLLEFTARKLHYGQFSPRNWYNLDPQLGFKMFKPSYKYTSDYSAADTVLVGDSIIFVPLFRGWESQLMPKINGHQMASLSAGGFSTAQEWLFLQQQRPKFPHLKNVILNFCLWNDFTDNLPPANPEKEVPIRPYFRLENNTLVLHREHIHYRAFDYFYHFTQLHFITLHMLRDLLLRGGLITEPVIPMSDVNVDLRWEAPPLGKNLRDEHQAMVERSYPLTGEILKAFAQDVTKQPGEDFLLIVHPHGFNYGDESSILLSDKDRAFFASLPFSVYDMSCHYRMLGIGFKDVAADRVGHLNEKGVAILSDVLRKYLEEGVLPEECEIGAKPIARR